jgi:hypothetical protein
MLADSKTVAEFGKIKFLAGPARMTELRIGKTSKWMLAYIGFAVNLSIMALRIT